MNLWHIRDMPRPKGTDLLILPGLLLAGSNPTQANFRCFSWTLYPRPPRYCRAAAQPGASGWSRASSALSLFWMIASAISGLYNNNGCFGFLFGEKTRALFFHFLCLLLGMLLLGGIVSAIHEPLLTSWPLSDSLHCQAPKH